jgi:hypothetical protein
MELIAVALFVLALVCVVMYNHAEISLVKYGLLGALASRSEVVDTALRELLTTKDDYRITNKEFRQIEKLYIHRINLYLLRHENVDGAVLRRDFIENKRVDL